MKKLYLLTLTTLILTGTASAKASLYTSLTSNGHGVFAGVKVEEKGMEPETYLLHVGQDLKSQKVSLPKELIHREVVGILPTSGQEILVISQRTVEQGDRPQVHKFHPVEKSWQKIAEVDCVSFAKIKVEKSALTFFCLETDAKGEELTKEKKVSLAKISMAQPGEIGLPMTQVKSGQLEAKLLGEPWEWKELKVQSNKQSKVIKAE